MIINRRVPLVIIPKDRDSINALYELREVDGNYLSYAISKEDLIELFNTKMFYEINSEFNVIIDLFEEEEITGIEKLNKLVQFFTDLLLTKYVDNEFVKSYIDVFIFLCKKAIEYNTGIFFYL